MKKYHDYQKDKSKTCLTHEEIKSINFTKYKIIVPTKKDKKDLVEAFRHIHNSDINTDFIVVNQLAHEYLTAENIIVDSKLYNQI